MKKFWLTLLLLGLIATFSTQAMAVDVKFSGEYYAAGMYLDRTSFKEDAAPSTAFYFQRFRIKTDFIISPGLSLVTRFDVMERVWGSARTAPGKSADSLSAATQAENENIGFDWVYVQYVSPIGIIKAGYMNDSCWGTTFGNSEAPAPKISYVLPIKNLTIIADVVKQAENSRLASSSPSGPWYADADMNRYLLMFVYEFKGGAAGLLNLFADRATTRPSGTPPAGSTNSRFYIVEPFVMLTLGPVKVQAELLYAYSNHFLEFEDNISADDVKLSQLAGWVDATANFGPVYAGASFAYVQGDDPDTAKKEGGVLTAGADWNPCIILWNYDRARWAGSLNGYGATADANDTAMSNAFFYQVRGGVKPVEKLDIMASVSYAYADKKPAGYADDEYGWEIDLTGTYKITNNLSYMLGAGYLFTGDYYKGASAANKVNNDFMVINKLTLIF
jgi:hypothetical protein